MGRGVDIDHERARPRPVRDRPPTAAAVATTTAEKTMSARASSAGRLSTNWRPSPSPWQAEGIRIGRAIRGAFAEDQRRRRPAASDGAQKHCAASPKPTKPMRESHRPTCLRAATRRFCRSVAPLIFAAHQSALLQDRHYGTRKLLPGSRRYGGCQDEAVTGLACEHRLELVGDLWACRRPAAPVHWSRSASPPRPGSAPRLACLAGSRRRSRASPLEQV
jgi:hypothetical protein